MCRMNTNDQPPTAIHVRVGETVADRLDQLAAYHGRSRSEEVRRALAIHDCQATLAYLQTPDAKAELGGDLAGAQATVKAELADLIRFTYRRPEMRLDSTPSMN
jgi:predicted transcriptional regulator